MNLTTKILVTALLILAIISSAICIGAADADDIGGGGGHYRCADRWHGYCERNLLWNFENLV